MIVSGHVLSLNVRRVVGSDRGKDSEVLVAELYYQRSLLEVVSKKFDLLLQLLV